MRVILKKNMISRKSPGKSIKHKCELSGCPIIVYQTASQKRLGRGRFCSVSHRKLYQMQHDTFRNFNSYS